MSFLRHGKGMKVMPNWYMGNGWLRCAAVQWGSFSRIGAVVRRAPPLLASSSGRYTAGVFDHHNVPPDRLVGEPLFREECFPH